MNYTCKDISKMLDHSLLNPTMTTDDLEKGIQIALDHPTKAANGALYRFREDCRYRLRTATSEARLSYAHRSLDCLPAGLPRYVFSCRDGRG